MAKRDIVVVGGSAGSGEALKKVLAGLPADFPGSIFVTTHIPSTHPSHLPELLGQATALSVSRAVDGQPIEPGHIYMAVQDRHLLLVDSTIRLGVGPRENMARPAIDPMFRSAALSYGPRAVGVVLSGLLNDGASGLFAITEMGGTAIVQHPLDAAEPDMPRAAIEAVEVDQVARADEIAELLMQVAATDAGLPKPSSDSLLFEVEVAAGARLGSDTLRGFADPVPLVCWRAVRLAVSSGTPA